MKKSAFGGVVTALNSFRKASDQDHGDQGDEHSQVAPPSEADAVGGKQVTHDGSSCCGPVSRRKTSSRESRAPEQSVGEAPDRGEQTSDGRSVRRALDPQLRRARAAR